MKNLSILIISVLLVGCKTTRYLSISDGSRSDGTITMMHSSYGVETSVVQWDDALVKAKERCKDWGYSDAKFFETYEKVCTNSNEYGCTAYNVYYKCQCISPIKNKAVSTNKIITVKQVEKKSKTEKLRELKQLLDEGILTEEEFKKEKEKILNETD